MIKPLIILFNFVAVFFYSLFFGTSPVEITGNFPKTAKPNTEFVTEIKINKGTIGGFAKLQLEVPQGFTVRELESKGGNFSFSANIAKIIWTATPNDAEFTVKFTISADATVSGAKTISSKFSYVNNNVKEVVEMTPAEIMIGDGASSAVATTESTTQTTPSITAVETNTVTPVSSNTNPIENPTEPNSNVLCSRTITQGVNANEYNVEVKIKKPAIKGFAKYQEILPAGYTAKQGNTNGSSFSVSDGKLKFVWVSLPLDDELNISYILEKGSSASDNAKIDGEFSYLENDQTKKVKLPADYIKANNTAITASNSVSTETTQVTNPVTTNPVATNTIATNTTSTNINETNNGNTSSTTATNTSSSEASVTSVAKKEGAVAYRVQIGAFTNAISSDVLSKKFNISETIKSEMAEGFSKFMVGNFTEYKEARSNRETVKQKGCNSAFVVAYNGAKRITVQEALMITSQKWFK